MNRQRVKRVSELDRLSYEKKAIRLKGRKGKGREVMKPIFFLNPFEGRRSMEPTAGFDPTPRELEFQDLLGNVEPLNLRSSI